MIKNFKADDDHDKVVAAEEASSASFATGGNPPVNTKANAGQVEKSEDDVVDEDMNDDVVDYMDQDADPPEARGSAKAETASHD